MTTEGQILNAPQVFGFSGEVSPQTIEITNGFDVDKFLETTKEYEFVDGKLEKKPITGMRHCGIASRLSRKMGNFVEENNLGEVYGGDTHFKTGKNRRLPDLSFVSLARFPEEGELSGIWQVAPDLAVEVVSPNDSQSKLAKKINEYFAAGVLQVWIIEPEFQMLTVFDSPTETRVLGINDELVCETILPDFRIKLSDVFRSPKRGSELYNSYLQKHIC